MINLFLGNQIELYIKNDYIASICFNILLFDERKLCAIAYLHDTFTARPLA